jgi:hypothetical protein
MKQPPLTGDKNMRGTFYMVNPEAMINEISEEENEDGVLSR